MLATEEIAAWVGLHWAEDQHEIRLQAAGSREVERYQVRQDPEELHEWVRQLRTRLGGRPVVIALEQKRGGLMAALMCYDFLHLYPVNPRMVSSYRRLFHRRVKRTMRVMQGCCWSWCTDTEIDCVVGDRRRPRHGSWGCWWRGDASGWSNAND